MGSTKGCKHFSFWSDGGCQLQDENAVRVAADNNVVSGPVNCDYEWEVKDGYLPQGANLFVGKMTPDQAKARCINMGCKGFTFEGDADTTGPIKAYLKTVSDVKE